jgi:serine protease AprX
MTAVKTYLPRRLVALLPILALLISMMGSSVAMAAPPANWEKIDPGLRALMESDPRGSFEVIVEAQDLSAIGRGSQPGQSAGRAHQLIRLAGGKPGNALGLIGGASGEMKANHIANLSRNPYVAYISHNRSFDAMDVHAQAGRATGSTYTEAVGAPQVWNLGYTGKGVGVAILDSGVAASNDLQLPNNRLIASVDFVDSAQAPFTDPGGHGTHVAGIVAGNGYDSAGELTGAYKGIAPGANIISVRVIGSDGSAKLDAIVKGIEWAVVNRHAYNIRVINLSLGGTPSGPYISDPLSTAVEIAWHAGIVVVVAAGNNGPGAGTLSTPGRDPYVITVGAVDDMGTASTMDDLIGSFSGRGPTYDGLEKPDIVAPGRRIVSLRSPGSTLDQQLPDRVTPLVSSPSTYFRLTGTSMSTPVVSGIIALMLERNPALTPDQVKFILTKTAQGVPSVTTDVRNTVGHGTVNAYAAITSNHIDKANRGRRPSNSFARTVRPLIEGQPLVWKDPWANSINWGSINWGSINWGTATWDNLDWDSINWGSINWGSINWGSITQETTWNSTHQDNAGQDSVPWQSAGLD